MILSISCQQPNSVFVPYDNIMVHILNQILNHDKEHKTMKNENSGVQSINRALSVLEAFPKYGPEIGLSELSRYLGLNKTTTYRILKTMESQGYVSRSPIGRSYRLGVRVFELGEFYQSQLDVRQFALPYLRNVTERTREATFLCIRDGNDALCIERVEAQHGNEYFALRVGGRQPLHSGGASRALLLGMSEKEVEDYAVETGLPAYTPNTITSLSRLKEDILQTRKLGYALSNEDMTVGIVAIGVPVRDYSGKVVAAISISGIAQSLRQRLPELSSEIIRTASLISSHMGYSE
jgi:IclR family transcriptional regulator, KDG regulon repressor